MAGKTTKAARSAHRQLIDQKGVPCRERYKQRDRERERERGEHSAFFTLSTLSRSRYQSSVLSLTPHALERGVCVPRMGGAGGGAASVDEAARILNEGGFPTAPLLGTVVGLDEIDRAMALLHRGGNATRTACVRSGSQPAPNSTWRIGIGLSLCASCCCAVVLGSLRQPPVLLSDLLAIQVGNSNIKCRTIGW